MASPFVIAAGLGGVLIQWQEIGAGETWPEAFEIAESYLLQRANAGKPQTAYDA